MWVDQWTLCCHVGHFSVWNNPNIFKWTSSMTHVSSLPCLTVKMPFLTSRACCYCLGILLPGALVFTHKLHTSMIFYDDIKVRTLNQIIKTSFDAWSTLTLWSFHLLARALGVTKLRSARWVIQHRSLPWFVITSHAVVAHLFECSLQCAYVQVEFPWKEKWDGARRRVCTNEQSWQKAL